MSKGKRKEKAFKFKPFSAKQIKVLTWWNQNSPVKDKDILIADGSVRAGKTVVMSLSFIMWAMENFEEESFALCGKTIGSLRRNVVKPLNKMLKGRGYKYKDHRSGENFLTITKNGKSNDFYLFGGKDEGSQDLIQGITLAGVLFDEVALMPQSFVNQATARCSVEGAKMWFNCNPDGLYHWFKVNYLDKIEEKNILHLHFTMDDNLSLSEKVKERYRKMYSGIFYKRYILGLWCLAEGIIYDMFDETVHKVPTIERKYEKHYVSVDYGTQNATVFLLWGLYKGKWYLIKEYYYSGRNSGVQKTDEQYSKAMRSFLGDIIPAKIIIDPSAASFIAQLRKDGFKDVIKAKNDVLDGIRVVSSLISLNEIYINDCCVETLKEFASYTWDPKKLNKGIEEVLKENDHCIDAVRYFCYTILKYKIDEYDDKLYKKGRNVIKNNTRNKRGGVIF